MLLSRIFSLVLGTTLFVLIWSMQDGNHSLPMGRAAHFHSSRHQMESPPESTRVNLAQTASVASATIVVQDHALWMFADEPVEQVAGK